MQLPVGKAPAQGCPVGQARRRTPLRVAGFPVLRVVSRRRDRPDSWLRAPGRQRPGAAARKDARAPVGLARSSLPVRVGQFPSTEFQVMFSRGERRRCHRWPCAQCAGMRPRPQRLWAPPQWVGYDCRRAAVMRGAQTRCGPGIQGRPEPLAGFRRRPGGRPGASVCPPGLRPPVRRPGRLCDALPEPIFCPASAPSSVDKQRGVPCFELAFVSSHFFLCLLSPIVAVTWARHIVRV